MRFIVVGSGTLKHAARKRPFRQRPFLSGCRHLMMRAKAMMKVLINKRLRVDY